MISWPFPGRRERLRRQAAAWIARQNNHQGADERAKFERWYNASPDHAATYDRLAAMFDTAAGIRPGATAPAPLQGVFAFPSRRNAWAAAAACAVLLVAGAVVFQLTVGRSTIEPQAEHFAAGSSASRAIRLADGSQIVLAPGSAIDVRIDEDERKLELLRGRGRFTVFHEERPFVVTARGISVVARGTQFLVALERRGTVVSLIEGRVEVSYRSVSAPDEHRVQTLAPGQRLTVPLPLASDANAPSVAVAPERAAMIDLDDVALGEALARVNRTARPQVRLAQASLGSLRVTGAFRAGDGEGFARSVATAFGLDIVRAEDGTVWLRHS